MMAPASTRMISRRYSCSFPRRGRRFLIILVVAQAGRRRCGGPHRFVDVILENVFSRFQRVRRSGVFAGRGCRRRSAPAAAGLEWARQPPGVGFPSRVAGSEVADIRMIVKPR
jgi:hypothetical protein